MKYTLNEIKGKLQGENIIVDAESAVSAMKKVGMSHWIRSYEKFSKPYFGKLYDVYETGKPHNVQYICHK